MGHNLDGLFERWLEVINYLWKKRLLVIKMLDYKALFADRSFESEGLSMRLFERDDVYKKLNKYLNELNMCEDHLKNKEKKALEVKKRKEKDMTNLVRNQDSIIKLTGACTYPAKPKGLKRLGYLIPDMGRNLDKRLSMMMRSSTTNKERKKGIANMGIVAEITNHINEKYMNVQTLRKETIRDSEGPPNHGNAVLAVSNNELKINIGKILEGVDMPD